jgi:hypothetical protein
MEGHRGDREGLFGNLWFIALCWYYLSILPREIFNFVTSLEGIKPVGSNHSPHGAMVEIDPCVPHN